MVVGISWVFWPISVLCLCLWSRGLQPCESLDGVVDRILLYSIAEYNTIWKNTVSYSTMWYERYLTEFLSNDRDGVTFI